MLKETQMKKTAKSRRTRRSVGFTLVELLSVVSIIAVLTALLLPALSSAKYIAKAITCTSNMKNIAQANLQYADDSNGYYALIFASSGPVWRCNMAFTDYLGMKRASPTIGPNGAYDQEYWPSLICPVSYAFSNPVDTNGTTRPGPYRIIYSYVFNSSDSHLSQKMGNANYYSWVGYNVAEIKSPSKKIQLGDGVLQHMIWSYINSYNLYASEAEIISAGIGCPAYRHNRKCNFQYFDGHVSGRSYQNILKDGYGFWQPNSPP
jgi:prepilin-type processing-associated H-X9-DG protein/prepilin-type N-terminal cleavage/methylation domain-containing protein